MSKVNTKESVKKSFLRRDWIYTISFALFLFLSLFPFAPSFTDSFFDRHRLLQVGMICVILLTGLFFSRKSESNHFSGYLSYKLAVLLFAAFGVLSAVTSSETLDSLFYTVHIALLFFLMLVTSKLNALVVYYCGVIFVVVLLLKTGSLSFSFERQVCCGPLTLIFCCMFLQLTRHPLANPR